MFYVVCFLSTYDKLFSTQPGTYSGVKAPSCSLCPAGKSCNDPSATPVDCSPGTYSSLAKVKYPSCFTGVIISHGHSIFNLVDEK